MNIIRINEKLESVNVEINTELNCVKNQVKFNQRLAYLWYTTLMEACSAKIAKAKADITEIKKTPDDKRTDEQNANLVLLEASIEVQKSVFKEYEKLTDSLEFMKDELIAKDVEQDSFLGLFLSPLCKCEFEITGFKKLRTLLVAYNEFEGSEEWSDARKVSFSKIKEKLSGIAATFNTVSDDVYKNSRMNISSKDTDRMIKYFFGGHKLHREAGTYDAKYRSEKELEKEFIKMCNSKLQSRVK